MPRLTPYERSGTEGAGSVGKGREPVWRGGKSDGLQSSTRWVIALVTGGVVLYSALVMYVVATAGDIGVRCVFGNSVKAEVPRDFEWVPDRPRVNDVLRTIDGRPINNYTDYVRALRELSGRLGHEVKVEWADAEGRTHEATATVRRRPIGSYAWSILWFLQEMVIFVVGALVFSRRPHDESARVFFALCAVTVGAFMGGYHWSEIVVFRLLIFLFAPFAMLVPVVSLHFYLVFPRPSPVLAGRRRRIGAILYGLPLVFLAALWTSMAWASLAPPGPDGSVGIALGAIKGLALTYVGLAVVIFGVCLACLIASYRTARDRAERNQVRWILLASLLASPLIAYMLREAWRDWANLGLDEAAWPMYVVSLLYTAAYAVSITRFKLMQAEEIVNRSVTYVLASLAAGLVYSLGLGVVAFLIGFRSQEIRPSREAIVVGVTAIVILGLSALARARFQRAIDRRFFREKTKFDQAMRRMSLAVGSLVDRQTLARRLLEAVAEVLRLEWGALYLRGAVGGPLELTACLGPEPDQKALADDNALVGRLRTTPVMRAPHGAGPPGSEGPADAMIALGGEVAASLEADGDLAGVLILGPKRSGLPYEDEETAFLGAIGSVAALALRSADIQQTLEGLNHDLRDKVEKIAEQQRRILILQDQLLERGRAVERAAALEAGEPPPPPSDAAFARMKGSGVALRRLIAMARKVAASPSAVLILGESGTGKELLAEAIHRASPQASGPFVPVHCAALSPGLLESELFGHVKGAFTGADRDRIGRFQQADGGTLFLDEIGDIGPDVQTKLLRVLQGLAFERVGSSQPIAVDVRIVAATNQDLEALIRAGRFREDLYYRLNVISIRTPPLRDRKEDVFELALAFLGRFAERSGKAISHIDDEAIELLTAHDWPGNVRELENAIERAVVLADGPALTAEDLPVELRRPPARRRARLPVAAMAIEGPRSAFGGRGRRDDPPLRAIEGPGPSATSDDPDPEHDLDAFERRWLTDALREARGNKSEAARLLGLPRSTFFSKLRKHDLA